MNTTPSRAKRILLGTLLLLANYGADRIAKILAIHFLKGRPAIHLPGDLAILVYAENDGAFLGMGGSWPLALKILLFVGLPLLACLGGYIWALRPSVRTSVASAALCVIGGGLGNIQDRMLNNFRVVDFLNFGVGPVFRSGILNVGDLSVTFGAIALILLEGWPQRKGEEEK